MSTYRKFLWSLVAVTTLALYALITPSVIARGGHGGGGHGGGFHGGAHFGGGHSGGHQAFHPYRPSQHHFAHHNADHQVAHRDEHRNHHHHSWHHGGWGPGGWGPGLWGGAALGYGLGGWAYDGGDTYVNDSTDIADGDDDANNNSDDDGDSSDDLTAATSTNAGGFPTDDWPELGINTYAGQYGGTQGQVVVRVVPNSAAAKAGIVAGDVILSLNGKPTPSSDAMDLIFDSANGKFTAEVWDARTGRKSTLSGNLDPATPAATAPQQL